MNMSVTLPIMLSQILQQATLHGTCTPNTTAFINGQMCSCDGARRWNCTPVSRRSMCRPGEVTWRDCQKCLCQHNGQMICSTVCVTNATTTTTQMPRAVSGPLMENDEDYRCSPYHIYYVECKVCACPASGLTSEAKCATDVSCNPNGTKPVDKLVSRKKQPCIPNVVYIFQCVHCICNSAGRFDKNKCIRTCKNTQGSTATLSCTPQTIFRLGTKICFCPEDGLQNDMFCTKKIPTGELMIMKLDALLTSAIKCAQNSFTKTRCIYCDCDMNGKMNENSCHFQQCLSITGLDYNESRACTPGTVVPLCSECFCHGVNMVDPRHCTRTCSYQGKLKVLKEMLRNSKNNRRLINYSSLMVLTDNEECVPNTVYLDGVDLCICPYNGKTIFKLCTYNADQTDQTLLPDFINSPEPLKIDFSSRCEPSTFVVFDCNSCFCTKQGTIDSNWCTYDNCYAKRQILESQRLRQGIKQMYETTCVPGTVFMRGCNYCLCKDSGLVEEQYCTRSECDPNETITPDFHSLNCEPLTYYDVDCNTCRCPIDGVKNVNECTKSLCENSFLRNDVCVPGGLFINECDICVCPPSASKSERVCKRQKCQDRSTATWNNVFKQSDLFRDLPGDTRYIDLCFPGEQFNIGCKLCICPEMGLRRYATCSSLLCEDGLIKDNWSSSELASDLDGLDSLFRDGVSGKNYYVLGRRNRQGKGQGINSTRTEYRCGPPGRIMDRCFMCRCDEHNTLVLERCLKSDGPECAAALPTFLNQTNILFDV